MAALLLIVRLCWPSWPRCCSCRCSTRFTPLQDEDLRGRLMTMAAQAGSPVRGVYVMDLSRRTTAANAMFTGIGPTSGSSWATRC